MKLDKRIIIICEGPTEQDFCEDVLSPYLYKKGIHIQAPLIKKSGGGIVSWEVLKNQIERHLKQEQNVIVTQLIDYYGIRSHHLFPKWEEIINTGNIIERVEILENAMLADVDANLQHRYVPYIQLHEFEAILFTDFKAYDYLFSKHEFQDYESFKRIFESYENPEMIDDNKYTCPSARLERHLPEYKKPLFGSLIAQQIGLAEIRRKCVHFDSWLSKLEIQR